MRSFVRYMNRDGKRFENLDQILRHLVSLGQHEDEIVQVRFIPIYQISDLCQYLTKRTDMICECSQMQAELAHEGWSWKEGLPEGWIFKKTVSKITFLTPTFLRCNNIQQVHTPTGQY